MSIRNNKKMYLGEQGSPIQRAALDLYISKYGDENAIGYLQALSDFNAQLEVIIGGNFVGHGVANSGHMVRKKLTELVHHNNKFVEEFKSNESSEIHLRPF